MKPRVFIASSVESVYLANAIQQNLDYAAECTVWPQGVFKPTSYTLESLSAALENSDFGVFVFSPEDTSIIRKQPVSVVRDNVIFELGLFIGGLGRSHTFIVQPRDIADFHLPTDLLGLTPLTFDATRSDGNHRAALGAACTEITDAMKRLGGRNPRIEDIVNDQ
jgi:predicted nucleotide-binding protein